MLYLFFYAANALVKKKSGLRKQTRFKILAIILRRQIL